MNPNTDNHTNHNQRNGILLFLTIAVLILGLFGRHEYIKGTTAMAYAQANLNTLSIDQLVETSDNMNVYPLFVESFRSFPKVFDGKPNSWETLYSQWVDIQLANENQDAVLAVFLPEVKQKSLMSMGYDPKRFYDHLATAKIKAEKWRAFIANPKSEDFTIGSAINSQGRVMRLIQVKHLNVLGRTVAQESDPTDYTYDQFDTLVKTSSLTDTEKKKLYVAHN